MATLGTQVAFRDRLGSSQRLIPRGMQLDFLDSWAHRHFDTSGRTRMHLNLTLWRLASVGVLFDGVEDAVALVMED